MDIQMVLNAMMAKSRQESLANSEQLTLGELILKLEAVSNKDKPVVFDFGEQVPIGLDSWRGSYAELSFHHEKETPKPVSEILGMLKEAVGRTYEGYKGGDFTMTRHTPIWVANWSRSSVDGYKDKEYASVGVVGVIDGEVVVLETAETEF